ncbi:hypothetical protein SpCBS45565_g06189 [Spizellomyces sp. 'palustris']|nr:hypothetical protein SpCBS45565_g06189 [Spizellomyces sp. 'palustris']
MYVWRLPRCARELVEGYSKRQGRSTGERCFCRLIVEFIYM